jgi:methyl-galactoside transport system ATP-binding protein
MNDLRDKGVAMIYISHKMDEIKRISDDITIMRDGTYVGTWPAAEMTTDQIIAKMVGRELKCISSASLHAWRCHSGGQKCQLDP